MVYGQAKWYNYTMFAEWLRTRMTLSGLTQKSLADKVGVQQQTVSKWLTGQSIPRARIARTLAQALDVTVDDVLGQVEQSAPATTVEDGPPDVVADLIERVKRLEAQVARRKR